MYAHANGIRIHYRVDGREGAPWVTFITGIANDTTMWDGQVAALAEVSRGRLEFVRLGVCAAETSRRKSGRIAHANELSAVFA